MDRAPALPPGAATGHRVPPATLGPVRSINRYSAAKPDPPAKVFWRRENVLKSGAAQSKLNRLSTKAVLWRRAMPGGIFSERQFWLAASL